MEFEGRRVCYNTNGYPWVYWPEHPVAMSTGMAYIHRVVAHEEVGEIPPGSHIHHIDGDKENWEWDNLLVLTPAEHYNEHTDKIKLPCDCCGEEIEKRASEIKRTEHSFCSPQCYYKFSEVIEWPHLSVLVALVEELGYSGAGRELGVSDNAVRKRISRDIAQLVER